MRYQVHLNLFFPLIIRFFFLFLRDKNDKTEFDFDKDKYDIRIPEDLDETGKRGYKKQERLDQIVPESDYSLRVCILFFSFIYLFCGSKVMYAFVLM